MRGEVAGIHEFPSESSSADGRDKPGHDQDILLGLS